MVELTNQNPQEATNLEREVIFSADRNWWRTILGPRNWRGKFHVGHVPSALYAAVDKISKIRESEINQRIAQHLNSGDTLVFGGKNEMLILIGDQEILIALDVAAADDLLTGRINSVKGLKGQLEADVAIGPRISFFNVRVGETYLAVPFRLEEALDTPTIFAISNPKSWQNHEATLLLDHYKGTRKLVLKSTA